MTNPNEREELLESLRILAQQLGRGLRMKDVDEASKRLETALPSTYVKHFGSLNAAFKAAGLQPNK
jgi:superfamily II DNA or RNA helicase